MVAINRKMKPKQETMVIKSALVLGLSKDELKTNLPEESQSLIEVPYNMMACLQKLKETLKLEYIMD